MDQQKSYAGIITFVVIIVLVALIAFVWLQGRNESPLPEDTSTSEADSVELTAEVEGINVDDIEAELQLLDADINQL